MAAANPFKGKLVLVTGGTGSIGSTIVRHLLKSQVRQIRILSRDESKQFALVHRLGNEKRLRLLIGDIRDKERVNRAMEDVDIVFHAAAMKHVLACENDPFEAVKTNVIGTQNVMEAALDNGVERFVGISTDKATDPVSVMGCTKLLAERIMLASLHYRGKHRQTKCCFVRFGNVLSTRGSVVPLFYQQIKNGDSVTVTDKLMYRFFMSIDQAVNLVFKAAALMEDREIFILKMPVIRIYDLAQAMIELYAPKLGFDPKKIAIKIIGRKAGERLHEKLLTKDEASYAVETNEMFVITPVIGREQYANKDLFSFSATTTRKSDVTDYTTEDKKTLSVPEIKQILLQDEAALMTSLWGV